MSNTPDCEWFMRFVQYRDTWLVAKLTAKFPEFYAKFDPKLPLDHEWSLVLLNHLFVLNSHQNAFYFLDCYSEVQQIKLFLQLDNPGEKIVSAMYYCERIRKHIVSNPEPAFTIMEVSKSFERYFKPYKFRNSRERSESIICTIGSAEAIFCIFGEDSNLDVVFAAISEVHILNNTDRDIRYKFCELSALYRPDFIFRDRYAKFAYSAFSKIPEYPVAVAKLQCTNLDKIASLLYRGQHGLTDRELRELIARVLPCKINSFDEFLRSAKLMEHMVSMELPDTLSASFVEVIKYHIEIPTCYSENLRRLLDIPTMSESFAVRACEIEFLWPLLQKSPCSVYQALTKTNILATKYAENEHLRDRLYKLIYKVGPPSTIISLCKELSRAKIRELLINVCYHHILNDTVHDIRYELSRLVDANLSGVQMPERFAYKATGSRTKPALHTPATSLSELIE